MSNDFPRRNRVDQRTPAEHAISKALEAVEAAGAHPRLTDASNLLQDARDAVADYVDGVVTPMRHYSIPADDQGRDLVVKGKLLHILDTILDAHPQDLQAIVWKVKEERKEWEREIFGKPAPAREPAALDIREAANANGNGWIGVDFDGTLAHYNGWKGHEFDHIGPPIPAMMERVKGWISEGKTVKVFTARAGIPEQIPAVRQWLDAHGLAGVEITNIKDRFMHQLWDDRAIQVEINTGRQIMDTPAREMARDLREAVQFAVSQFDQWGGDEWDSEFYKFTEAFDALRPLLMRSVPDPLNGSVETPSPTAPRSEIREMVRPDLVAIYGREVKASPGPWKWAGTDLNGGRQLEAEIEYREHNPVLVPYVCDSCNKGPGRLCLGPDEADSDFIAHAREDIPALLKYIHALEQSVTSGSESVSNANRPDPSPSPSPVVPPVDADEEFSNPPRKIVGHFLATFIDGGKRLPPKEGPSHG
jgi:hypothetical protein